MEQLTYFILTRKIFDSAIWRDEPHILKLFIYLIGNARHSKTPKKYIGFNINRGELVTSLSIIADDNEYMNHGVLQKWSRAKVSRMLQVLKEQDYIKILSDTYGTHISICNYDTYQNPETYKSDATETEVKRVCNGSETEVSINNNDNNDNNENNECDTETARTLIIKTLGITKPAYIAFATEIIAKFGQDKARQIFREFADKGFNVVQTMRESLDENGNIIPKNLKNTLLSEITYSELIKLNPTDQTKYERLESGKWKLKA